MFLQNYILTHGMSMAKCMMQQTYLSKLLDLCYVLVSLLSNFSTIQHYVSISLYNGFSFVYIITNILELQAFLLTLLQTTTILQRFMTSSYDGFQHLVLMAFFFLGSYRNIALTDVSLFSVLAPQTLQQMYFDATAQLWTEMIKKL